MSHDAHIQMQPMDVRGYAPGVCNIGPAEIARRRLAGHIALAISVVLFAVLLIFAAPHWLRLLLVLTVAGSASGYLQAFLHFCAGFGSAGTYNFGPVGTVEKVTDGDALRKDHARSRQILLASLAIGLVVGVAAFLLPVR